MKLFNSLKIRYTLISVFILFVGTIGTMNIHKMRNKLTHFNNDNLTYTEEMQLLNYNIIKVCDIMDNTAKNKDESKIYLADAYVKENNDIINNFKNAKFPKKEQDSISQIQYEYSDWQNDSERIMEAAKLKDYDKISKLNQNEIYSRKKLTESVQNAFNSMLKQDEGSNNYDRSMFDYSLPEAVIVIVLEVFVSIFMCIVVCKILRKQIKIFKFKQYLKSSKKVI